MVINLKLIKMDKEWLTFRSEDGLVEKHIFLPDKEFFEKNLRAKITKEYKPSTFTATIPEADVNIELDLKPKDSHIILNGVPITPLEDNIAIGRELARHLTGCKMINPNKIICKIKPPKEDIEITVKRDDGFLGIEKKNGDMFWVGD